MTNYLCCLWILLLAEEDFADSHLICMAYSAKYHA